MRWEYTGAEVEISLRVFGVRDEVEMGWGRTPE